MAKWTVDASFCHAYFVMFALHSILETDVGNVLLSELI